MKWHITLLCLWPELQHPIQSANLYTLNTKNQFQTGSDMSVQVVSWYQPFVTSFCLSVCGCFLPSIKQNYLCCLSSKQYPPNLKKNMTKYLFLWVQWLKWTWTIYFPCTSIITRQNTSAEREINCATASHGVSIGCVYEHNVFAQILLRTVHLHYSTVYFKSYLSCIGRARSAYEADISVTFYDWCCLNNVMAHLTSFCYGT